MLLLGAGSSSLKFAVYETDGSGVPGMAGDNGKAIARSAIAWRRSLPDIERDALASSDEYC